MLIDDSLKNTVMLILRKLVFHKECSVRKTAVAAYCKIIDVAMEMKLANDEECDVGSSQRPSVMSSFIGVDSIPLIVEVICQCTCYFVF